MKNTTATKWYCMWQFYQVEVTPPRWVCNRKSLLGAWFRNGKPVRRISRPRQDQMYSSPPLRWFTWPWIQLFMEDCIYPYSLFSPTTALQSFFIEICSRNVLYTKACLFIFHTVESTVRENARVTSISSMDIAERSALCISTIPCPFQVLWSLRVEPNLENGWKPREVVIVMYLWSWTNVGNHYAV